MLQIICSLFCVSSPWQHLWKLPWCWLPCVRFPPSALSVITSLHSNIHLHFRGAMRDKTFPFPSRIPRPVSCGHMCVDIVNDRNSRPKRQMVEKQRLTLGRAHFSASFPALCEMSAHTHTGELLARRNGAVKPAGESGIETFTECSCWWLFFVIC